MRRALAAAVAALVVLVVPIQPARAQSSPTALSAFPVKVFAAVDSVMVSGTRVTVRGVLVNEEAVTEWYAQASGDNGQFAATCQRAALLAMERPGKYLLELYYYQMQTPTCRLTLVTP